MNERDHIERRVERAAFETDRHLVVGDVTLPPAGYQSRFSDSLNRVDVDFMPLTNVEITSLARRQSQRAAVHRPLQGPRTHRLPAAALAAARQRLRGLSRAERSRLPRA